MSERARKTTISDVAGRAGVSVGTVSAVLNGRSSVREQTRRRVLKAIDSLGYVPATSARTLGATRSGRSLMTPTVGLIVKELDNPFFADVAFGAQEVLGEHGYVSLVCSSEGDYEKEGRLLDILREREFAGVIVSPLIHRQVDLEHLFTLRRRGFPFVLLESVEGLPVSSVSVENVCAAALGVSHLIDLGHQRIVHFAGPEYTSHTRDRILGVQRAFSESSLVFDESVVVHAGAHLEDGYRAAMELFGDGSLETWPTGVTCFNDMVAIGVMHALHELEIRVPADVSVVGFDDVQFGSYLPIPLTTVRTPRREMGREAARLLLEQIEGEPVEPRRIVLDAELVERESTRRVRRRR